MAYDNPSSKKLGNRQSMMLRDGLSRQEVISKFEKLRHEQRHLYAELADAEMELYEHREVIKVLRHANPSQTCYSLMSDVMIRRRLKDAFPVVLMQKERIENTIEKLNNLIQEKGKEVLELQTNYNIRVKPSTEPESEGDAWTCMTCDH